MDGQDLSSWAWARSEEADYGGLEGDAAELEVAVRAFYRLAEASYDEASRAVRKVQRIQISWSTPGSGTPGLMAAFSAPEEKEPHRATPSPERVPRGSPPARRSSPLGAGVGPWEEGRGVFESPPSRPSQAQQSVATGSAAASAAASAAQSAAAAVISSLAAELRKAVSGSEDQEDEGSGSGDAVRYMKQPGGALAGLDTKSLPLLQDSDRDLESHVDYFNSILDCHAAARNRFAVIKPYDRLIMFDKTLGGGVRKQIFETQMTKARRQGRLPHEADAVHTHILARLRTV